jgi:hypothetical protein
MGTDNGELYLANVRLSYLYCFEPYLPPASAQNPKATYRLHALIAPTDPQLRAVAEKIEALGAAHQWKGGVTWAEVKEQLKGKDAMCLHKGEVSQPGKPEYKGMFYVSGSRDTPYTVVDSDRTPLRGNETPRRPVSGDWGNVYLSVWVQDNQWGRRINATVTGLQFVKQDVAFGSGPPPKDPTEFGVVNAASADAPPPAQNADPLAGLVG